MIKEKLHPVIQLLDALSFRGIGFSSPNPPVAAVITNLELDILAIGHTQISGKNHAEREAYSVLEKTNIPEHYLFVTLEPCTHFGKTAPCIELILKHKPKMVFIGWKDANPVVQKNSFQKELNKLGIEYIYLKEIKEISEEYLEGFLKRIQTSKPKIILKSALSKEGFFSTNTKNQISITNEYSNEISNRLRSKVDAILVGPATVYHDSPRLNLKNPKLFDFKISEKLGFWNQLKNSISDIQETKFINENYSILQPFRIFYISCELGIRDEFIQIQEKINIDSNTKKIIFILSGSTKDRNNLKNKLQSLTNFTFIEIEAEFIKDKNYIQEKLFAIFAKLELNTLLIEGGNFFYEMFEKDADLILEIQTNTEIENGVKPKYNKNDFIKENEFNIVSDVWNIYKKLNKE